VTEDFEEYQNERIRLSKETLLRIEAGLRDSRELIRAQQLMHGDLLRLLSDFRRRQDDHGDRLTAAGM
jgi:hypothetical protein